MELNKIYNESCLDTMSRMDDESVDLIITSPPYNKAGYAGKIRKRHKKDTWQKGRNIEYDGDPMADFKDESIYKKEQIHILNEMHRVLKRDGSVFYNHKVRVANHVASHPIEWILKSKLVFRQQITWDRKASPQVAPIRYLPNTELIFWLTKEACQPNFLKAKNVMFGGEVWELPAKPNKLHPAPFPEEIPKNIIMCLERKKDVVVYDPYSGTGTTCRVAKDFGLSYIGSELVEEYYDLSKKLLNVTQTNLF